MNPMYTRTEKKRLLASAASCLSLAFSYSVDGMNPLISLLATRIVFKLEHQPSNIQMEELVIFLRSCAV